ncbi:3-deoxy-7-phosphoheptulonate synthase, partial [Gardnerella vaginalis]
MESTAEQCASSVVKKAVENGQNPLNSAKFQRWEDQVGVDRIINRLSLI